MPNTINEQLRARPQPRTPIVDDDGKIRTLSGQEVSTGGAGTSTVTGMTADQQAKLDGLPTGAALTTALAGKASLVGGKLDPSQVPDIALQQYLGAVANEAAMLALAGQLGDWCTRSDTGTDWRIVGNPATLAGWLQTAYPSAPVSSVNGKTGAVTLAKGDVGLGNVDNTSDVNKPVSAAQATAIGTKMDATLPALQTVFDVGTAAQKAAFQSSVSEAAPLLGVRENYTGFGNSHMAATPGFFDAFCGVAPVVLLANAGVGGNTSAALLARIAADVPSNTRVCVLIEGTNDAIAIGATSLTLEASTANWRSIIAHLRLRGIQPLIVLPPPAGPAASYLWAVNQQRLAQLLIGEEFCVPVYDPYRILMDPATSGYISGASSDGVHAVNASATLVGQQLWADISAGRLASLVPTCNSDRGIAGVTANCLMLTAASGVPDGWVKGTQGVASTESAAADSVAGNWARLDATTLSSVALLRTDRLLPRVSQGAGLDRLHLQMALKYDPGAGCSFNLGVEWRSADAATLIGSTTLIGGLTTSVAATRLQRRLIPPAGAALARVIVSIQPVSGTYSGTVRVGEFRLISIAQASGLM